MINSGDNTVFILMAVFNGGQFLDAQLESIGAQTHKNWVLIAGDDGSTDNSLNILDRFSAQHPGRVNIYSSLGKGAAENFRFLLTKIPENASYFAFSDQDDVWFEDKLERAVVALDSSPPALPVLYCSRTMVVDRSLNQRHPTKKLRRRPSFQNALIQNIAAGNTIVANKSAARLLISVERESGPIGLHDWWAYQVVTAFGGSVIFDDRPSLLYRQHGNNQIGATRGISGIPAKIMQVFNGQHFARYKHSCAAIFPLAHRMLPESQRAFQYFHNSLMEPRRKVRLRLLRLSHAYGQSKRANLALWVSAFFYQP